MGRGVVRMTETRIGGSFEDDDKEDTSYEALSIFISEVSAAQQ